MPYKPSLMTALSSEYEDAAKKFMEARNHDATEAERYLCRMKLISKNMKHLQMMMDGTLGKAPAHTAAAHTAAAAVTARPAV